MGDKREGGVLGTTCILVKFFLSLFGVGFSLAGLWPSHGPHVRGSLYPPGS